MFVDNFESDKVSVCITTYNRSSNIKSSVYDVLNQTHKNIELIIIDDCSDLMHKKKLIDLEKEISDSRAKFIFNEDNKGLSYNRNFAIEVATGSFFSFKDDDDGWEEDFLEVGLRELKKNRVEIFCSGYINLVGAKFVYEEKVLSIKDSILLGYTPPVGGQIYKMSAISDIKPYRSVSSGVDHDLWINLAARKSQLKVQFSKEALIKPDLYSDGGEKMTTNYKKRFYGIERSLIFWEEDLKSIGGDLFYNHFISEYKVYLVKRFFLLALKRFDFEIIRWLFSEKKIRGELIVGILRAFSDISKSKANKKIYPLFKEF